MPIPNTASATPNRTTDMSQALSTSFLMLQCVVPKRSKRVFSRCHADFNPPPTLRGQKP